MTQLTPRQQLTDKNGKYYNFWQEISGQLSDGMWENEPYQPGYSNFAELISYVGDRLLFLGAAQRIGLNIKDDSWIQSIIWIFFNRKGDTLDHDLDKVLNDYLVTQTTKGDKYWIDRAHAMIRNKDRMKLIWDYIQSGQYDYDILYNDLEEFNTFYLQNHLYMYGWRMM